MSEKQPVTFEQMFGTTSRKPKNRFRAYFQKIRSSLNRTHHIESDNEYIKEFVKKVRQRAGHVE